MSASISRLIVCSYCDVTLAPMSTLALGVMKQCLYISCRDVVVFPVPYPPKLPMNLEASRCNDSWCSIGSYVLINVEQRVHLCQNSEGFPLNAVALTVGEPHLGQTFLSFLGLLMFVYMFFHDFTTSTINRYLG